MSNVFGAREWGLFIRISYQMIRIDSDRTTYNALTSRIGSSMAVPKPRGKYMVL